MLKRLLDIVLASAGLLLCTPLFVVAAALIKLESRGPVFFRQVRVGRYGRLFRVYKLRTMIVNRGTAWFYTTPEEDPRITRTGKLLRKFNIDELAQFINVLKGEMSIVGPRPEIPHEGELTEEEKEVLSVKPGITDLATLWFRDKVDIVGELYDAEHFYIERIRPEKVRLQLEYVRNRSIWLDMRIMLRTLKRFLIEPLWSRRPRSSGFRQEQEKHG